MRIPIVNEQDEIIGYEERENANPKNITRVSALWVTDKEGNILLAQRAFTKKYHPGVWGPAASGTIEEGETYESNIIKEAEEEIGLIGLKPILGPKNRVSSDHEYFRQVFTCVADRNYVFKKQDEEVEALRWFTRDEIAKFLEEKPEMFSGNFKYYFNLFK